MLLRNPKILYQGVDTLVTSHKCLDLDFYKGAFRHLLIVLEKLKLSAQQVQGYDKKSRFVIHEFPVFGRMKVYAQGGGRYSYHLSNDDVFVEVSEAEFDNDTPNIRVRYSNQFLFFFGEKEAYNRVLDFVSGFLGQTKNIISEIHLCTDVSGVVYEQDDKLRFQTRLNSSEFEDMRLFTAFNRVNGIYFGKGSFLFRIYNKLKDLQNHPDHYFFKFAWFRNGYSDSDTDIISSSVFRHEIQYRREYLKKYLDDVDDEPLYFFDNLEKLWFHVLEKIEFVSLTDDELYRVKTSFNVDTVRQIRYRAKKDTERFHFWPFLRVWRDDVCLGSLDMYPKFKEVRLSTLKKKIKEVVSLSARLGLTPEDLKNFVAQVDSDLVEFEGITLEQYGKLRVLDSFAENERIGKKFKIAPPRNLVLIKQTDDDLKQAFVNYDVISKRKEFRASQKHIEFVLT